MNFKVNRIVKYLILSDLFFWTGWGLINPIFAIFIVQKIAGGSAFVAGMAAAIYWILKSALRVPVGVFLDKCPGEKDDYFFLVVGLSISATVSFGFIFATQPWHIYLLQSVYAVGMALTLSGWQAIFTRHIDKGREATEWALDAMGLGFGTGIAGAIGGWVVTSFGFEVLFAGVGLLGIISVIFLFGFKDDIKGVFDHGLHFSFKEIFHRE